MRQPGGIALWLCHLLRHVGARTIGTASTAEKLALTKDHGAGCTISYREDNFVERMLEITNGEGVQAVFDSVGKDTLDPDFDALAPKGITGRFWECRWRSSGFQHPVGFRCSPIPNNFTSAPLDRSMTSATDVCPSGPSRAGPGPG